LTFTADAQQSIAFELMVSPTHLDCIRWSYSTRITLQGTLALHVPALSVTPLS